MTLKKQDAKSVEINAGTTEKRLGGITGKGFMPGRSGNPGGRPKKLPISERYHEVLETKLPPAVRLQIEMQLGIKLRKDATFADAIAVRITWAAVGCYTLMGGLDAAKEIREAVEGKTNQRLFAIQPEAEDPDDLRKQAWAHLIKVSYEKAKLYGMEPPDFLGTKDNGQIDSLDPKQSGEGNAAPENPAKQSGEGNAGES